MLDLQKYINDTLKARRSESLAKSDQLTLGEIILKVEAIIKNKEEIVKRCNNEPTVVFDFEHLHPNSIDSWRGSYEELALGFTDEGKEMTITEFLKMLKDTLGKTLTGYKGGDYLMSKHTPIWVANYGNAGNTAVIEVVDNEFEVILITAYREL